MNEHVQAATTEPLFNPLAPEFIRDPYPYYARLRATDPMHVTQFGAFLASRHAEASLVLRDKRFGKDFVERTVRRYGPQIMQATYKQAFGTDPARQKALSPTLQAGAPNAPQFLLLHVQRPDGVRQAEALEKALVAGGSKVERGSFPGEGLQGHAEINRRLGDPGYVPTATVDAWLKRVFGR